LRRYNVEIYNEQVRDLLQPGAAHDEKHSIVTAPEAGAYTRSLLSSTQAVLITPPRVPLSIN
jgi:hypothetical protein